MQNITAMHPSAHFSYPITAVALRRPAANRWVSHSWHFQSALVLRREDAGGADGLMINSTEAGDEFIWGGLTLTLYPDEAESYYHNLVSPRPSLYLITRPDAQSGQPVPFLATASYDLAHAYTEADSDAHPVPLPAQLYADLERFVLEHYVPQRPKKRKRQDWAQDAQPPRPGPENPR